MKGRKWETRLSPAKYSTRIGTDSTVMPAQTAREMISISKL